MKISESMVYPFWMLSLPIITAIALLFFQDTPSFLTQVLFALLPLVLPSCIVFIKLRRQACDLRVKKCCFVFMLSSINYQIFLLGIINAKAIDRVFMNYEIVSFLLFIFIISTLVFSIVYLCIKSKTARSALEGILMGIGF